LIFTQVSQSQHFLPVILPGFIQGSQFLPSQAREFIFTAARLYIFCRDTWAALGRVRVF
jgi:hypothetical protein